MKKYKLSCNNQWIKITHNNTREYICVLTDDYDVATIFSDTLLSEKAIIDMLSEYNYQMIQI